MIIKEKYKKKVCKDSVKVKFMDNDEYKAICHEDEYYTKLKQKIDTKLAQIEKQKQAKRVQLQQERLIRAREMEAMAAQKSKYGRRNDDIEYSLCNYNNSIIIL